ncbi:polyprenol phosphomannose-dependent alpha 1,6 mannosyltransferase MptB [Blastococcus goldschmidtiae]|uniref:Polyprenol phosphomannose-dependent alpha 1,6 mannosyltransferase MptB n=1 Tax=Blastococcus goldschmidtiae TaxID=3075546 RepID=A0ABU2K4G0_9ACTN|nr:polyprenol phosphomannose-dependent alpha 1,6 mannosyltransferase MptB [Blastococcus sp. DSM 46792]MDT0275089.1 polyprenol phosphomannose-dependent alpha 1,6 mannosyltransferase MptB [Blastococcus sp. DSM 46792]
MAVSTSVAGATSTAASLAPASRPPRSGAATAVLLVLSALLGAAGTTYLAAAGTSLGAQLDAPDLWFRENHPALRPVELGFEAARSWTAAALGIWVVAWLLAGLAVRRGVAVRWLLAVGVFWSVPLLIGPPLFTADPWFYTAIGAAVQNGVDPFEYGPGVLGDVDAVRGAERFWRFSPTPYSPPFVALLSGLSWLFDQNLLAVLAAIRVLCVAGWAVCALLVCRIAQRLGGSPAVAMWLGAINPLVLVHLVSGNHNDALMLALLLPGLLLALYDRPLLGILLCVAGAGIKATALVAVLVIGVDWAQRQDGWPARLRALALAGGLGAGAFALSVQLTGWGWGFLDNLDVPGKALESMTPTTALAFALDVDDPPIDGTRVAGVVVAVVVSLLFLTRLRSWGLVRVTSWIALTVILTSSVVWPWYLVWPTMLFAAAGVFAERLLVVAWSVLMLFTVLPGGHSVTDLYSRPLVDQIALGVLGVALVAGLVHVLRSRRRRTDPMPEPAR